MPRMEEPKSFVGVDIGGSQIKALAFARDGSQLTEEVRLTADDGNQEWLKRVQDVTRRVIALCPAPVCVGLAAPGLVSPDQTRIAYMPGRLSGLEGLDWQQSLNNLANLVEPEIPE